MTGGVGMAVIGIDLGTTNSLALFKRNVMIGEEPDLLITRGLGVYTGTTTATGYWRFPQ